MTDLFLVLIISVIAIIVAIILAVTIKRIKVTNAKMSEIAGYIAKGAMAYLKRQYKVLIIFLIAVVLVLGFIPGLGWNMSLAFIIGAILSILAGFFGMRSAVSANVRTAEAATKGLGPAFKVAFSGGAVMGLLVVGLGALGICIVSFIFNDINVLTGFSFGASSIALFCRVGGGIYTKAADVGADLVGKVEAGIPEDDPRNPAVIADNVGDNVGDIAGMGADLFESYVGCIVSALLIAATSMYATNSTLVGGFASGGASLVMLLVAAGIAASIIGVIIVRCIRAKRVQMTLTMGTYIAAAIFIVLAVVLSLTCTGDIMPFLGVLCGIIAGLLIGKFTEIYTSADYNAVKKIAKASQTGPATTILSGYATGLQSTLLPIITLVVAILLAFFACGEFGVVLAALGMLATVGIVISVDAYGPVADNAGGIAEMSGAGEEVRKITDHLDSVGNTTAALGKGFSIGSAALTALALFTAYSQAVNLSSDDLVLTSVKVIAGIFIGGVITFLFASLTINSVSKAANKMIEEVRRQFKASPGLMAGTEKPDYERCVDISTRAAIKEMILPGVLAIVVPIVVGVIPVLGPPALAGLLAGALIVGVLQAISMANSGGAWDNAKKYIEEGHEGGKGSEPHKAAVIGDTVGDPFKDTAGPSMNILIKLMSIVALVFIPLFLH